MASALPIVSTRHNGIPEAVLDDVTGHLVDEQDVDGMAAAMAKLFDHPERAANMGAAGRDRVLAHFTLEGARPPARDHGVSPTFGQMLPVSKSNRWRASICKDTNQSLSSLYQ